MNEDAEQGGIWFMAIVKYALVLTIIFLSLILVVNGFNEESVRELIRWTARISFVFFCLAFSVSAIHPLVKNSFSWWLMMNRKYFGITFAIVHIIHLGTILLLQMNFHPVFEGAATISLLAGGIAYFFIVSMLLTSFETFSKMISKNQWKWLHLIGGYWIWGIFFSSYIKRVDEPIHWIAVTILLIVLLLRIIKWTNSRVRLASTN